MGPGYPLLIRLRDLGSVVGSQKLPIPFAQLHRMCRQHLPTYSAWLLTTYSHLRKCK